MTIGNRSSQQRVLFVSLICIISNISYYPVFVANGWGRTVAIAVWILLAISLLGSSLFFNWEREISIVFLCYILFVVVSLITSIVNGVNAFGNHFFRPVSIALLVFFLCNRCGFGIGALTKICTAYYYCSAAMAVLLFFFYIRGTDYSSPIYAYTYGKNEIPVLFLCALFIACTVYFPKSKALNFVRILASIFFVADIFLLRARTEMLCVAFLGIVLLLNKKQLRKSARVIGIAAILAIGFYFITHRAVFDSFLNNIVYAGRDAKDIDSLSSGRISFVSAALKEFINHPFAGVGYRFTCDCFYASALANYGILSIPIIIISLYPLIWSIKHIKVFGEVSLCFFLIAGALFIVSILEELAPFGPGTRCYFLWLMWGILVRNKTRGDL